MSHDVSEKSQETNRMAHLYETFPFELLQLAQLLARGFLTENAEVSTILKFSSCRSARVEEAGSTDLHLRLQNALMYFHLHQSR